MGEEISTTTFSREDFASFAARLAHETAALGRRFGDGSLSDDGYTWGFELEAWLLDHGFHPVPRNAELLEALDSPDVVPELSRFNVELNTPVRDFAPRTFSAAAQDLATLWAHCNAVAHGLDANMVMIGTLPTIRERDLSLANISPLKRYYALNHELLAANRGRPLEIRIDGRERLALCHSDVMLEGRDDVLPGAFQDPGVARAPLLQRLARAVGAGIGGGGQCPHPVRSPVVGRDPYPALRAGYCRRRRTGRGAAAGDLRQRLP